MSYIILRDSWYDVIVLNVYAPTVDKTDDMKDSFFEKLECEFDTFLNSLGKILLGYFNAKVGRKDIFKPNIGNESLNIISNDNGVTVVNFGIPKNLIIKSAMF
jgi:hypothetical protein